MKKALYAALGSGVLVAVDQIIKLWAINSLKPVQKISLIDNVLSLFYHQNFGAAFGILQNQRIFLVLVTTIVIIAAFYLISKETIKGKLELLSVTLILGGGIGNLLDRIFRGFVVDYIYFEPINFPIFNFADCCVVIGTALLVFCILRMDSKAKESN